MAHTESATAQERSRVLIAGTVQAFEMLKALLRIDAEFVLAQTVDEALRHVQAQVCLILCSVRFDQSRMFDFLHALKLAPAGAGVPVICCRTSTDPWSRDTHRAIKFALEALGVGDFLDLAWMRAEYGSGAPEKALRTLVMERLPARPKATPAPRTHFFE